MYRADFDRESPRYPRDPFYDDRTRDRVFDYDDRERGTRPSYPPPPLPPLPPLDDPFYRRLDDLESRALVPPRSRDSLEQGAEMLGSVIIIPPSPFETKPRKRDKPLNCDTIFVGSLPDNITERHLYDLFSKCGKIAEIRIAIGRNFAHVQFQSGEMIEQALELSGCRIRIGPSSSLADTSKIHVDFAQARGEADFKKRIKEGELMIFSPQNASIVSTDLHREEAFQYAAKNLIHWIERRNCTQTTSNTFFGLISSVNTHCRKVAKNIKAKQEQVADFMQKHKSSIEEFENDSKILEEVFEAACQQKAWDHFTKPQRKTITQWKDAAMELSAEMKKILEGSGEVDVEPPAKMMKLEPDTQLQADLERAQKEIEQLKVDHEIAVDKKDKQIFQLKTLLARFKQACPEEWEKAIGTPAKPKEEVKPVEKKKATVTPKGRGRGRRGKKVQPLPPGEEEGEVKDDKMDLEVPGEAIEGVNIDDLNEVLEKESGDNSLAAAAAAYAQAKSAIATTTEVTGLGLMESEVAVISVIATFLTVNPLGATIKEVTTYLKNFNAAFTTIYVESIMRRLPQVFQLSQASEGQPKWWFSGFNTCCSQNQYDIAGQNQDSTTESKTSSPTT